MAGLNDGMLGGIYPSGISCANKPNLIYCIYNPNNVVGHRGGSDIAWTAASGGTFFISQSTAWLTGGSTWKELRTVP